MALLGAGPVADLDGQVSPYAALSGSVDLELHPDPARVHRLIESIKLHGKSTPAIEDEFRAIVSSLASTSVLLACTELPLVTFESVDIEVIDVTDLLARALVSEQRQP